MSYCLDLVRKLGALAHVELDQVVAWVRWYLDRDRPKALFADTEVLDATTRLKDRDPIEFAEVELLLRKRKLWTVFNGAVKHKKTTPKECGGYLGARFAPRDRDHFR